MSTLVNDLRYTLDVPCKRGVFGMECTAEDYESWRRVAVALRQTIAVNVLIGAFPVDRVRAITSWLMAWVDKDAPIGLVQEALALQRSVREGDPDLKFPRKVFGMSTPVDVYAGRFPPRAPTEISVSGAFGMPISTGPTAVTKALVNYIKEGYPYVKKAVDAGTLPEEKVAGELELAEGRDPAVVNWIPLALVGAGILGTTFTVAYFISLFVRARKGQITATGPIADLGGTYAKVRR